MLPLDGQETRAEKTNVTVDILTEFYARYPGLPSRFRNDTAPGQQTGRLSARPRPPSVAISVGTTPMIAIPVAAFMGSVAMIVGPAPQTWCNHFGLSRPMIAIPTADDCGSLQVTSLHPSTTRSVPTKLCLEALEDLLHLRRRAVIYIRQSTPHQVLNNQESLR